MKPYSLFIYFLFCQIVLAQNPYSINYSTNDGLPSSTIYSINQDEKGFLWFTTDAGIAKFDSHTFTLYTTDNGLSDNEVFQMKKDSKGRTWLLTLNGKTCFYYNNKLYNEFNSDIVKQITGTSFIIDFYEDDKKNCYFVYRNGATIQLKPNNTIVKIRGLNFSHFGVWKFKDELFFLSNDGVYGDNSKRFLFNLVKSNSYRCYHIGELNYFSLENQLYRVNKYNQLQKIVTLPDNTEIIQIYKENNKKLWICTRTGLYLLEDNIIKSHFFSNEIVSNITQDFEGGYWISTLKNGAYYVPSFNVFVDNLNSSKPLKLNCINKNASNEIWIGGDNNDYYYKMPGHPFIKKTFQTSNKTDQIKNIRFFKDYTYVVGKKMIVKIDSNKKTANTGVGGNDIFVDNSNCYIGFNVSFKLPIHFLNNLPLNVRAQNILSENRSYVITKDSSNTIWFGTNCGLKYYTEKDSFCNWNTKSNILQNSIEDLYFDQPTNSLYVATTTNGIFVLKNKKIIARLSKKNGLNSMSCNAIKKIKKNYYLVATNNGLNAVSTFTNSYNILNLNAVLGLKNKKVNDITFLDNTVYLATDNGLMYFNLNNIVYKRNSPKCIIQHIKNQNKNVPKANSYRFNYNSNDIRINFTGISYLSQNNLTYFYKLNSFSNFYSSTQESQINYSSLAPGKYVFRVYCIDGFGVKSNIDKISFEVLAPFWQKAWFVILCILILGLLIFLYIKYRLKNQQKQFEQEKTTIQIERDKANMHSEMVELKQKALRLQMNPHFIFNALNTIKGYYSEGDSINASSYISKFSKLLRMLLENTEQTIALSTEIEMLDLYVSLAQTRYKNKFDYEVFVDEHLNHDETAIPTLLLQPIVENAIIHGLAPKENKGILKVSFIKKGERLECTVEDNGIGRIASKRNQKYKEYQSKAIEITTKRIALFSENIGKSHFEIIDLVSNRNPTGTKVIVSIPLLSIWQ